MRNVNLIRVKYSLKALRCQYKDECEEKCNGCEYFEPTESNTYDYGFYMNTINENQSVYQDLLNEMAGDA